MEEEYQSLIPQKSEDIGTALQNLINDNLKNINTSFLGRISKINGNKVSIVPVLKTKATDSTVTINNCMVCFPMSGFWNVQYKLKVGDIGVAIVMKDDISGYKNNGKTGLNATKRNMDIQDSVFVPFSLFKTLTNDDINFLIENDTKTCKLEFDNDENGTLKAKLLTLQSETTTLKTKLSDLATILENALINQSSSGTQPFAPATVAEFASWKTSLDTLFKD